MNRSPCSKRVFPFRMASWLPARYETYLLWLSRMLERLGYERTLAIYREVYQNYEDELLLKILQSGWNDDKQLDAQVDVEESIATLLEEYFPVAIQGVSQEGARQLVEEMPPIQQIRQYFPSFKVSRETTAYEALHIRFNGLATLTETLIRFYGKQGELIAYDLIHEERIKALKGKTGSVAEFMAFFSSEPEEANLFTAGLEIDVVHTSEREVVQNVRECEWARYFQENHPQVGYLIACSTDEAAYRAFNEHLRMQRTSTLMEGSDRCDFRVYAVGEEPDSI